MLGYTRKSLRLLGVLELYVAVCVLALIVMIVLSQVFSRYALGLPLIWAEELATYLLIWLGFIAAAVAYKLQRHITIQTFGSLLPPALSRVMLAAVHIVVAAVLVVIITYIPSAMRTEAMQTSVGLPIPIGLHWFFSVPTLIACLSMLITAVFYALDTLRGGGGALLEAQADPSLTDDIIDIEPNTETAR